MTAEPASGAGWSRAAGALELIALVSVDATDDDLAARAAAAARRALGAAAVGIYLAGAGRAGRRPAVAGDRSAPVPAAVSPDATGGWHLVMPMPAGDAPLGVLAVDWPPARGGAADRAAAELVATSVAALVDNARRVAALRADRRSAARAQARGQDDERRRIADDVHDGPIQQLAGLSLTLDGLAAGGADPAAVRSAAAQARAVSQALREVTGRLHPAVVAELGLEGAAHAIGERLRRAGLEVTTEVDGAEGLDDRTRVDAYRVLQEAATNVIKHAEATAIIITIKGDGARGVTMTIDDDGRGVDPARLAAAPAEGHLGVAAMRLRAEQAGGRMEIGPSPAGGTRVRLVLPAGGGGEIAD